MSEMDNTFDLDKYDEMLLDFIRQETEGMESIMRLEDDDILYLLELWYEYIEDIDEEDEEIEIDSEELYEYVIEVMEEDEIDFELSVEDLVLLIRTEQEFTESLTDDFDEELEDEDEDEEDDE